MGWQHDQGHDQGRSKASIRTGKREEGSREGRQDCHKTEPQGYRALRCRVLAGDWQQEQGKSTYPGGDPALNFTTGTDQATRLYGTDRRPAFRRTSSSGPSKNSVQASAATAGLPNKCLHTSKQSTPPASFPVQCARALDHRQSVAFLAIRARTGRVEERRGAWSARFLSPLIKPDLRISRIRLSDRLPDRLTRAVAAAAVSLLADRRFLPSASAG